MDAKSVGKILWIAPLAVNLWALLLMSYGVAAESTKGQLARSRFTETLFPVSLFLPLVIGLLSGLALFLCSRSFRLSRRNIVPGTVLSGIGIVEPLLLFMAFFRIDVPDLH